MDQEISWCVSRGLLIRNGTFQTAPAQTGSQLLLTEVSTRGEQGMVWTLVESQGIRKSFWAKVGFWEFFHC
jgi:hypothetical protein